MTTATRKRSRATKLNVRHDGGTLKANGTLKHLFDAGFLRKGDVLPNARGYACHNHPDMRRRTILYASMPAAVGARRDKAFRTFLETLIVNRAGIKVE
jgi:hypothetical protein